MMTDDHKKELNMLLNFVVNSRKLQKIIIHEKYKDFEPRLYPHVGLQAPPSSQKTQTLKEVAQVLKCEVHHDITYPNLVGSISKDTKQLLPAAIWNNRKAALLLDEFNQDEKSKVLRALLPIMEDEYYSRGLGLFCVPSKVGDKNMFMRVKDGRIEIKVKLPIVFGTMHNYLYSTAIETYALMQRCIWYDYNLTNEERQSVMDGEPLFVYEPIDVPKVVEIDRVDYSRLLKMTFAYAHTNIIERATLDIVRAFSLYRDYPALFNLILRCKNKVEEYRERALQANTNRLRNLRPRKKIS